MKHRSNVKPIATEGKARAPVASRAAPAQRVLDGVVAALKQNRGDDAVRRFLDGLAHGIAPKDADIAAWLIRSIGRADATRLIKAFVEMSCFYCRRGVEVCATCRGRSHVSGPAVCDACVGLGVIRCDYCGGSGWVNVSYAPPSLRLSVIVGRARRAIREFSELKRARPAPFASDDFSAYRRQSIEQILRLNRVLSVLENAVLAAGEAAAPGAVGRDVTSRIVKTCRRTGTGADRRLRQLLQLLAQGAMRDVRMQTSAAGGKLAEKRVAFYELISKTSLAGTMLDHPFLLRETEA